MDKKQVEIVVKHYLRILKDNNIAVERAILYGSQTSGAANKDSDIDIVIVSKDFGRDYIKDAVRLKLLTLKVNPDISPRPYSLEDYSHSRQGDFLFDEVIRKGKVVS